MQQLQRGLGVNLWRNLWRPVVPPSCGLPERSCTDELDAFEVACMVGGAALEGEEAKLC